ncbi:MAG: SDR family oxidoreductase [Nitrospinae bacterium]|nr:SDR family oxidoreductase [Nitrospinota bacterium]
MTLALFDLTGKVAIVTGGNGGLGLGMALGLAGAGANIVVGARNQEKTRQAVAAIEALGVKALGVYLDVLQPVLIEACVQQTVEAFGGLDILVANSGTVVRKPPEELSAEEWDLVLDTNLKGTFLCCKAAFPHLVKRGGGKIITNGSMFSIFGSTVRSAYPASKGGIVQLSKSLAVAWAKYNIQVNCILPGWLMTELTMPVYQHPEWGPTIVQRTPAGRWGTPDDMQGTAMFLASRASDFVTGTAIPVDGGFSVMGI